MKKIILLAVLAAVQFCSFGQNTMKFLGIPIDGTKEQMISALKNKGYTYDYKDDWLKGEFNGENVIIQVQTNNNKVYRLAILDDKFKDETNIKIRYNNLFDQFLLNGKYLLSGGKRISDEENISFEMTVSKKRYEAAFIPIDIATNGVVWYMIVSGLYGQYRIAMFYENLDNKANGDDL